MHGYTIEKAEKVFHASYIPVTETGCWLWLGVSGKNGYGVMRFLGTNYRGAHRVSYVLHKGELLPGMHVHHKCNTPACVNPDHLDQVTPRVNSLASNNVSGVNARKTHCRLGHPLSGSNLYIHGTRRHCRECRKMHERNSYQRAKQCQ